MAKKKFKLEFDGLEEMMEQFENLETDIIPVVEKALKASHEYITPLIHEKMKAQYMPSGGKYMGGRTIAKEDKQIIDEPHIEWQGLKGTIDVGFSLDEGIVPIFLINGTKNMNAVKGLKNTIYGKKTQEEIAKIQEDIFSRELEKVMNSGK